MRVFKNKSFARFARKALLHDTDLCRAVRDMVNGLVDADLGGGVFKQRVARRGGGKSGGFRVIVLFRAGDKAFFVHGFAKNEQDNIRADELTAIKKLAKQVLSYSDDDVRRAIAVGVFEEVACYEKKLP